MHYFVKLAIGGTYMYKGVVYSLGQEQAVNKEVYDYLEALYDTKLVEQGDRQAVIKVPYFTCRTEDYTVAEKVAEEVKDAPNSLRPRRTKTEAE